MYTYYKGVSVLVIGGDVRGKGNAPQVGDWAAPACEHGLFRDADLGSAAVVQIDLVVVANGDVDGLRKLAAAEERLGPQ